MDKNKILIASGTYLPEVSGQSTFVSGLIEHLPDGMDYKIVAYGKKKEIRDKNIFIVSRNICRYFNYWRVVRKQGKDAKIVFAQDLISSGLPAALAKRRGQKLIIRVGGDFLWEKMVNSGRSEVPFSKYYQESKSLIEKFYLMIYRFVMKRVDRVVFNSRWQKDVYKNYFNLAEEKTQIVENSRIEALSDVQGNINQTDEIIFAGRFVPLKNLERLVEAFKKIDTNKKLILIGDGPSKSVLSKIVDNKKVFIEEKMDQKSLFDRLGRCYMLVLPSLSEMNPHIALEALGRRKPVVLTVENGFSSDIKKYFRLVNPLSVEDIKDEIEYFLDEENYNKFLRDISGKYPVNNFDKYSEFLNNL